MERDKHLNEDIYEFLNRMSNSVGMVVNEYHWREVCGLMKRMENEDMVMVKKPEKHYDNLEEPQYKTSDEELLKIITSGCKFEYESYDHQKALEEYITADEYEEVRKWNRNPNSYDMPDKLKIKYKETKIGTLRSVEFSNGKPYRFRIGKKYAKSFELKDFGVKVFPII